VFSNEPPVVVPDVGQVVGEAQVEEVRLLVHVRAVPANIRSRDHGNHYKQVRDNFHVCMRVWSNIHVLR
jgi:hypothetical protein